MLVPILCHAHDLVIPKDTLAIHIIITRVTCVPLDMLIPQHFLHNLPEVCLHLHVRQR